MTTSTPPAWHFLEEKYVPVTTDPGYYPADVDKMCREYGQMREEALFDEVCGFCHEPCHNHTEELLSIHSHKLPDSDAFRERNDSDQCPDCRCAPNTPHAPGCAGTTPMSSLSKIQSVRERPNKLRVGARNEHPACELPPMPDTTPSDDVAGDDALAVPFRVQDFMFEELCEEKLAELPHLIFKHSELIIEMARDRFRKGYAKFGSAMYSWTPERRLDETLQELADAVVYPTSGSLG